MKLNDKFPKDIENIIFDFGGVIMDINIMKTINAFSQLHIDGLKTDDIISGNKKFLLDLELGLITPQEFIAILHKEYPGMNDVPKQQIWDAWNALLLGYDPKRVELIEKLKNKYNLYLLSNTNLPHRVKFKEMYREQFGKAFESLFIKRFYSDAMHLRKPDLTIYNQVIEEAGIDPSKTLFIDDNELNITCSREVGLIAYHLTNGEKITDLFIEE